MEYVVLAIPALIIFAIGRDIYLKVWKPNFCKTCKYFYMGTYCTHEGFKRHDYVRGTSWSPMAGNVRDDSNPHCSYWEEKKEVE